MAEIHLNVPFDNGEIETLKSGDTVLLSGTIYTARDAAHKRMTEQLENGQELPVDLAGQVIYYVGPTPAKPGRPLDRPVRRRQAGWMPTPRLF